MRPVGHVGAVGSVLCAGLLAGQAAWADTHDFPSADSEVVSSVGFKDDQTIGWFWSQTRGDRVTETFDDPLASVTRVVWEFDIVASSLREPLTWALLINGEEVTRFDAVPGQTGPQMIDVSFDPVDAIDGTYEVSVEARSTVAPGFGSHDLRYAGDGPHSVTLFGDDACPADLDGDGQLTVFDFLEFQNLFDAGDLRADFDGDGELSLFDFLAFQNAFDVGCG